MTGLTTAEVLDRQHKKLTNQATENASLPIIGILLQHILDLPTIIIFACVGFLLYYNQIQDALMISGIMAINVIVSIAQEFRARQMLSKLKLLRQDKVTVIRNSVEVQIDTQQIVLDDLIVIQSGQFLYVDGVLLDNDHLLVDESILTGESDYVRKKIDDQLLSGSFITSGRGIYKATKVGKDSLVNKITHDAKQYQTSVSPLQNNINNIVKTLLLLTILTLLLLFVLNFLVLKMDQIALLSAIVSIVTAMVPQGIILTVTLSLTLGTIRMAQKNILVQKLNAVETLAGIKVLCMDKTGTITANKLNLIENANLSQETDSVFQEIIANYCKQTLEKNKTIKALEKTFTWIDSMSEFTIQNEMPFNSKIKQSGIEAQFGDKKIRVILGSIESITNRLDDLNQIAKMQELNDKYAKLGYRNLFMVYKWLNNETQELGADNDLHYSALAFFSLEDKLRDNAGDIINGFIARGVKPVIISGDNPNTLTALMQKLNISELNKPITGPELAKISDSYEFDEAVTAHDIFARVTPEQKVQIIKSFQKVYKYVAMIGDGVNDALAIKQANLGIALGSGADAAKNISDVVLLDDNLLNLNEVIVEGRRIIYNSRRGAQLIIGKNIYALIIIVLALLLSLPFPFNTRGLFVLSLFISSLSIIFILGDNSNPPQNENFLHKLYSFILSVGISAGIVGLTILLVGRNLAEMQTILLSFLLLTGQFNYVFSLNNESLTTKIQRFKRKSLLVVFLFSAYLIFMYVPVIANSFLLDALTVSSWLWIILAFAMYITIFQVLYINIGKLLLNRSRR
jgi:cation-transporting ATPase E